MEDKMETDRELCLQSAIDLVRNVAGLDDYALAHMTVEGLRATILEYRADARKIAEQFDLS
jgi:hypothetical protein